MLISSPDLLKVIGKKIKNARIKKGYTQEYVAEHINISTDLLRNIENNRNVGSLSTLLNLCNILDITPNYLFYELLDKKENTVDITLYQYFQKFSKTDKETLKNIIVHIDKNY